MRAAFYHTERHCTGATRAFAMAARGLAARGHPVTIVCPEGSALVRLTGDQDIDVVPVSSTGNLGGDAWRLRSVLKDRFIEVVFLHSEREHLVASSAMRLAERGAIIRRIPAGASVASGRSGQLAGRLATSRLLFATEADRARAAVGERGFVAPLGVDVAAVQDHRASARAALGVDHGALLIVCAIDRGSRRRVSTAMRTVALLAPRHPELRLVIAGCSDDTDGTRMHAAALGISPLVELLGDRDNLPHVFAAADIGWVASEGDDGAFACLDFMAAGVPVLAERSSLVSHYVPDGIAGLLLPAADPGDTASAVARFLADGARMSELGIAGQNRARRDFGAQALVDGFVAAASAASDRAQWAAR